MVPSSRPFHLYFAVTGALAGGIAYHAEDVVRNPFFIGVLSLGALLVVAFATALVLLLRVVKLDLRSWRNASAALVLFAGLIVANLFPGFLSDPTPTRLFLVASVDGLLIGLAVCVAMWLLTRHVDVVIASMIIVLSVGWLVAGNSLIAECAKSLLDPLWILTTNWLAGAWMIRRLRNTIPRMGI